MMHPPTRPTYASRGAALVTALAVVIILSSLLLVFARQMQTEARATRNYESQLQARLIAEGVARAIQIDLQNAMASSEPLALQSVPTEAGRVGDGLYWIIQPNWDEPDQRSYGLISEAGKLSLNAATAEQLELLPEMTAEIAGAIVDWRDTDQEESESGAESNYYLAQDPPYNAKDGDFETIEELLMVRDVDPTELFGEDANRNGMLEPNENDGSERMPDDNSDNNLTHGLYAYTTVYAKQPNTNPETGEPRVNVNQSGQQELLDVLQTVFESNRATELSNRIIAERPHRSLLACYIDSEITTDEAGLLTGKLTTRQEEVLTGLVDVNHASAAVLDTLPGLEPGDGDTIVAARRTTDTTDGSPMWLVDALGPEKAKAIGSAITTESYQFTADIVAVSANGRGYCRLRVVFDCSEASERVAPNIVYMKDLTNLGWPLDRDILDQLRSGTEPEELAVNQAPTNGL